MDEVEKLVRRAQRGDDQAFGALYHLFEKRVYVICRMVMRREADVEDAAQESFTKAWEKIRDFRFECPFFKWLEPIIFHTCLNVTRTKKYQESIRERLLDTEDTPPIAEMRIPVDGPEKGVVDRAFHEHALNLIRHCARSTRPPWDTMDSVIFKYLIEDGIKPPEIADRLQRPIPTIRYRIYKRIDPVLKCAERKLMSEDSFS